MYKLTNTTTKEAFLKDIEWNGQKIKPLKTLSKYQKGWQVSDRFGNVWNIIFNGNVNEYSIYNVCKYPCDAPFKVDIISTGNKVEIYRAEKKGRKIKSDRLLKNFAQLGLMVNCYCQFGHLK